MRRVLLLLLLVLAALASSDRRAHAGAPRPPPPVVWTGGGLTNNWSDAANWSTGTVPGAGDNVLFDKADKDIIVDTDVTVLAIQVKPGYTGTLTINAALTVVPIATADPRRPLGGTIKLEGGTTVLSATGSITTVNGNIELKRDAVLDIGEGTVAVGGVGKRFAVGDTASVTISTGTLSTEDGKIEFKKDASLHMTGAGTITVGGNQDFNIGDNASVIIDAGTLTVGKSLKVDGKRDGSPTLAINDAVVTVGATGDGDFSVKSASVTMTGTSVLNVDKKFDVKIGASFVADVGTVVAFTGDVDPSSIKIEGTASFGDLVIDKTGGGTVNLEFDGTLDVNGSLTIEAGNTLDATNAGLRNAAITVAGDWTDNGTFVPSAQPVTFDGGAAQTISGDATFNELVIANSSDVTIAPGATVTSNGNLTVDAGSSLALGAVSNLLMGDGTTLLANGGFSSVGTSMVPGEQNIIAAVSGSFTTILNGDVVIDSTVFDGISAAGITLGGGAGITAYIADTFFMGLADPSIYYLSIVGAGWADAVLSGVAFEEVGPGPNTTGTIAIDLPGIATNITMMYYGFSSPPWSSGETTSANSGDDTIIWSPLAVTLGRAAAWPVAGGVQVAWEATTEHANAGFIVERSATAAGPWEQITKSLIAGRGSSRRTRVYRWLDESPDENFRRYRLVDIERTGRRTTHRSFRLMQVEPVWAAPRTAPPKTRAALAKRAASADSAQSRSLKIIKGGFAGAKGGGDQSWRVVTRGTGVFEIDAATLLGMGIAPGTPVSLTCGGEALFASRDASGLRFFAPEYRSRHALENVVFISASASEPAPPSGSSSTTPLTPGAVARVRLEEDAYYCPDFVWISSPNGEAPWYYSWEDLGPGIPWVKTPDLGEVVAGSATLRLRLVGWSSNAGINPDHEVVVSVNGVMVGRSIWDSWAPSVSSFEIPADVLESGTNEIRLDVTNIPGAWNDVLLDWVEIEYAAPLVARDDELAIDLAPGAEGVIEIGGFTGPDISVFQVEGNSSWPVAVTVEADGGEFKASAAVRAGASGAKIVFACGAALKSPERVESGSSGDLRALPGTYSYIVVTPREFRDAANAIAIYRTARGQSVLVAELEDITDQFSHGRAGPEGIVGLVAWHSPRYLLLLGGATCDPLDLYDTGDRDFVPGIFTRDCFGEVLSDAPFAETPSGLEVAVGRLPARDLVEATDLVAKVIAGEAAWSPSDPAIFIADKGDPGFRIMGEACRTETAAPTEMIDMSDGSTFIEARGALHTRATDGARMIFYSGHGSWDRWSNDGLLMTDDAPAFALGKPTVTVALSCLNSTFAGASWESLGEALLRAPDAGAWAALGSVGYTDKGSEMLFGIALSKEMRSGVSLGEAMLFAKRSIPESAKSVRNTFVLLGDPASGGSRTDGLRIISPQGGEVFMAGDTVRVLWSWTGNVGSAVVLELSTDGGATWKEVASETANTGSLDWVIPEVTSDSCLLRLSSTSVAVEAVTRDLFSVKNLGATVASPDGGCAGGHGSVSGLAMLAWLLPLIVLVRRRAMARA